MARVVFDLDGTLIDSAPGIRGIANGILREEGLPEISLAEAHSFIGHGAGAFVAQMRAARGIADSEQERLLGTLLGRYEGAVGLSQPYPGVPEALAALVAGGHVLALCTNKPEAPARLELEYLGVTGDFGVVVGGDSLAVRKPDPGPLRAVLGAMAEGPSVYVGDSEVDAETAQAAGVAFLLFTGGYRKSPVEAIPHDAAFDDFADLPALVAAHAR
ncbi:phosphoglycolate phosphatase [Oceanicola sp. 22II-s10i]|uniref:phosphoglycolate phosphatase n=1 Tax=Oceanicola sp. 22II-s10i TaxID=1317116 RepID=UPI000B522922|nr:phosphoglycolate phosphatase [Oceanicola sp. 22II-s10i]OWU82359.1 phosphoglycolate phosphatase [Oceanicola sp. 22II-s10i]